MPSGSKAADPIAGGDCPPRYRPAPPGKAGWSADCRLRAARRRLPSARQCQPTGAVRRPGARYARHSSLRRPSEGHRYGFARRCHHVLPEVDGQPGLWA